MPIQISPEDEAKLEALSEASGVATEKLAHAAIESFVEYDNWVRDAQEKIRVGLEEAARGELSEGAVVRKRLQVNHRRFLAKNQ